MRAGPMSASFPESDSHFRRNYRGVSWDSGQRMKRHWQSQSWRSKWSFMYSGLLRSNKRWQDPSLDFSGPIKATVCVLLLYLGVQTHTSVQPESWADLSLHWLEIPKAHPCRTGMTSSPVNCLQTLAAAPHHTHVIQTEIITDGISTPAPLSFITPPSPQCRKLQLVC